MTTLYEMALKENKALQSRCDALEKENERLREQLRPGSSTERAPTQEAYDLACAALHKHRERAVAAEAQILTLTARVTKACGALQSIASCESHHPNDIVAVARRALASLDQAEGK